MKVRAFTISLVLGIAAMGSLTPAAHAASASPATLTVNNCQFSSSGTWDETFTGQIGDTFQIINSDSASCALKISTGVSTLTGWTTVPSFDGHGAVATVTGTFAGGDLTFITPGSTATFTIVGSGSFTLSNNSGSYFSSITVVVPTSSQTSTPAAPTPQTVTFQTPLGAACSTATDASGNPLSSSVTVTPQWVSVPTCTREGSTFLGWSTSPIFPVSVAQAQVDARYGAWDGTAYGMRMIFIPHYWHTYISADNTLYPVWG